MTCCGACATPEAADVEDDAEDEDTVEEVDDDVDEDGGVAKA